MLRGLLPQTYHYLYSPWWHHRKFIFFFQTDKHNSLCQNQDFSRFLKIWLVLSWLANNWNWNEFRGINKCDYIFTLVSCGNSLKSIFLQCTGGGCLFQKSWSLKKNVSNWTCIEPIIRRRQESWCLHIFSSPATVFVKLTFYSRDLFVQPMQLNSFN